VFEIPPCFDGHGLDCPDRACIDCGTAIAVGPLLIVRQAVRLAVDTAA
jgi:hypothetical protein